MPLYFFIKNYLLCGCGCGAAGIGAGAGGACKEISATSTSKIRLV
jgi:hypothetical protein